jgi:hypothetical protein
MKKEISSQITINAVSEKVWKILIDFENYPLWNPFIKSLSGKVEVGNKIKVRIEPPGGNAMQFSPKILVYKPNEEIKWLGHLIFPGLFDGEHRFEVIDDGDDTTTFRQSEKFSGILVVFFKKMLDINTTNGFNLMNQKLKELAENE